MNALLLTIAILSHPAPVPVGVPIEQHPTILAMLKENNRLRAQHGLEPHRLNRTLCLVAQKYARVCADRNRQGHFADGRSPWERVKAAGYNYRVVRENWAGSFDSIKGAYRGWMSSGGHRASILSRDTSEAGFGYAMRNGEPHSYVGLYAEPATYKVKLRHRRYRHRSFHHRHR